MTIAIIAAALALSFAGLFLAHEAWRRRTRPPLLVAFALWAAATALWTLGFGAEIGVPLALDAASLAALAFILARAERRTYREPKEREVAPAPLAPGHWLRGGARALLAGPLGLAAALALGMAMAVAAPLTEQTRLILAGLLVPSFWAGAMLWSLASRGLLRPALGLGLLSAAGFAIALLPGR